MSGASRCTSRLQTRPRAADDLDANDPAMTDPALSPDGANDRPDAPVAESDVNSAARSCAVILIIIVAVVTIALLALLVSLLS